MPHCPETVSLENHPVLGAYPLQLPGVARDLPCSGAVGAAGWRSPVEGTNRGWGALPCLTDEGLTHQSSEWHQVPRLHVRKRGEEKPVPLTRQELGWLQEACAIRVQRPYKYIYKYIYIQINIYYIQILKRANAYVPGRRSRATPCTGRRSTEEGRDRLSVPTSPDPPAPHPVVPTLSLADHSRL